MLTILPLWLLYAAGWVIHLFAQAKASAQSNSNGLKNTRQWFELNWHIIIVRVFLAVMTMLLWTEAPNLFGDLMGRALPMTKATCGIAGFAVDSAWDKITYMLGLRVEIPQVSPPNGNQ